MMQPDIQFVPMSTDEDKIRFFGTLMPALLLMMQSPRRLVHWQVLRRIVPKETVEAFVAREADDAAAVTSRATEDEARARTGKGIRTIVFVHGWAADRFDPVAFARAKTFLERVARLVEQEGYRAERLDPLSPQVNLPALAARAGLGTLSPFGLLIHPRFGPRLILSGLRTDLPLVTAPRWQGAGCSDCLACLEACPQEPQQTSVVRLAECQSCALCLAVCPVGTYAGLQRDA